MHCTAVCTLLFAITVAYGVPAAADDAHAGPLQLATFQCDLTPPLGSAIYSSYRPLATIEHPLLAKGLVLVDGERRYVLCAVDWCELCNSTHTLFRRKMAVAAGTAISHVAIQTIHQHTAPMGDAEAYRLLELVDNPPGHLPPVFFEEMADRLAESVKESLEHVRPFDTIGTGQARVEGVASTRRVLSADGKIRVRWSSCRDPALRAEPEGRIDPFLKTVTFARGEKPLARLHFYAVHPQSFYGDPRASYDFPGIARESLQEKEGVFQVYFTGCGGDVTAGKYNDGSREARVALTARLLAGMEAAIAATAWQSPDHIGWRTASVKLPLRTEPAYSKTASLAAMSNDKLSPAQRIYAGAMRVAFIERAEQPIEISALAVGPAKILHLPGESMIDFQLFAQGLRPDAFVAVAAYGDCGTGYICTDRAFEEGGYEPTDAMVAPGSEAILKDAIRELLAEN